MVGVSWSNNLSWKEVINEAKRRNKLIFVECYATWCIPCKYMDKEVYTNDSVIYYLNNNYVSVKLQIDSTSGDSQEIKKWYNDAHILSTFYKLNSFPTFLFFSPSGEIIHKDVGVKPPKDFIKFLRDIDSSDKQYYTLLRSFDNGNIKKEYLPYLANMSKRFGDVNLAKKIAKEYIEEYLLKLGTERLYTEPNIEFMASYIDNSKDKCFDLFYEHKSKIDSIVDKKGYAESVINFVIYKEDIKPYLTGSKTKPRWNEIYKRIKSKYNSDYANQNILTAKISWYGKENDWSRFTRYSFENYHKYGIDTTNVLGDLMLNNTIWDGVFLHSKNKKYLKTAIFYMEGVIRRNPKSSTYLDTYANLLYKLGKKDEALQIERKALALNPEDKSIMETFNKIKNGEPTWTF